MQKRVDRPHKNKIKSIGNPTSINPKNNILITLLEIANDYHFLKKKKKIKIYLIEEKKQKRKINIFLK